MSFRRPARLKVKRDVVMIKFSNDTDILKYGPILFGELYPRNQVLISGGGGTLSGTTFTATGADFASAKVSAGGVVYLASADGSLDGAYEIVSVDSATQLSVSVLRSDSDAVSPPSASDITYRVSTYDPQAAEVGFELTQYFGIWSGNPESDLVAEDILDTGALRRASTFGVISAAYAMLSGDVESVSWNKSIYYRKLYEKARERCRFGIDQDGDGKSEISKSGGSAAQLRD
jgi:hypothetical protein